MKRTFQILWCKFCGVFRLLTILIFDLFFFMNVHARIAYSIKHGFHLALTYLANAKKLEYENFFIFSASYRSTSKEYRLVSAKWKPCFRIKQLKVIALNNEVFIGTLQTFFLRPKS